MTGFLSIHYNKYKNLVKNRISYRERERAGFGRAVSGICGFGRAAPGTCRKLLTSPYGFIYNEKAKI